MSVYELNRDQLIQLKQSYLCDRDHNVSYGELALADELVSDKTVFEEYGGFRFTPDDFA